MHLALLVALAVQPSAAVACAPDTPAVQAVRAVADGIVAADNRRDLDAVLAFYAPDAVLMPPNAEPVQGAATIRGRYELLFAGFQPAIEGHIDEACADEGLGFVRGHNGGRMSPRGPGAARELDDSYLMLLRRDADGRWRISHLIWHPAGAPPK